MALAAITCTLIKGRQRGKGNVSRKAGIGVMQSRNASSHQKLEEARKDSPLEPPERQQSCSHLDFRLLASRSLRE